MGTAPERALMTDEQRQQAIDAARGIKTSRRAPWASHRMEGRF